MITVARTIQYLRQTAGVDGILERGRAFRTERPSIDRAVRITFDVNHSAIFYVDVQTASHRAIGADALHNLRIASAWNFFHAFITEWLHFGTKLQELRHGGLY